MKDVDIERLVRYAIGLQRSSKFKEPSRTELKTGGSRRKRIKHSEGSPF